MADPITPVPGSAPSTPVAAPAATPGITSPVTPQGATPAQPTVDVEKLKQEKERYEAEVRKYQEDLNRFKSASQKREDQLKREAEARATALEKQLEEIQLAGMDDDERKEYERQSSAARAADLERRAAELEQQNQEQSASFQAYTYFLGMGVPASALVVDQGYDALFQSGWGYIQQDYQRLKNAATAPVAPSAPVPPEPPKAPPVVAHNAAAPGSGMTWEDVQKKYNTNREGIYRLYESGRIPQSVMDSLINPGK